MTLVPAWWKRSFLWAEFGVAVIIALAFSTWSHRYGGSATIDATLKGNRGAIYGALATIFGSLLGFVITASSIVLGFSSSDQLSIVRGSSHYPTMWRVFTAAIRALALATAVSLVALVVDRDKSICHWALYILVFSAVLAILRIARCIWVLEKIIFLIAPAAKTEPPTRQGKP